MFHTPRSPYLAPFSKIRNPDAGVTVAAKLIATPHRQAAAGSLSSKGGGGFVTFSPPARRRPASLILTGSPIQNNLRELWSLFDFVFPGRLGNLPTFEKEIHMPIQEGSFANASQAQVRLLALLFPISPEAPDLMHATVAQVEAAFRCACVLRDTIQPNMLRRAKSDVQAQIQLPERDEQVWMRPAPFLTIAALLPAGCACSSRKRWVHTAAGAMQVLFCKLTPEQRRIYTTFLASRDVSDILEGQRAVLPGMDVLRKARLFQ
jgi:DNA excision repair protein ERCC-6